MVDAIARSALVLGILYLAFQAFPIIFEDVHGFNVQQTGLSFLGIGIGMFAALGTQPYWNRCVSFTSIRPHTPSHACQHRLFARQTIQYKGNAPPEVRLIIAKVGAIIAPLGRLTTFLAASPRR